MKRFLITLAICITAFWLFTSCGSTQGHCDAYGNKAAYETDTTEMDIYSFHNESMSKYSSVTSLK